MVRVLLVVQGVLALSTAAHADPLTDQIAEELRRQEQREDELRRERERTPDVRLKAPTPEPETAELPRETPCFTINQIRLEDIPPGHRHWAQSLVDRYLGSCIGREGINQIIRRVQQEFLTRGFVTTRVYVPPQDLVSAVLTLKIVPGRIRTIRFADPEARGSWRTAFPSRPGDLLSLRDLEQGLEQLKRVPSQDVEMEIVPGDAPGESDVVIQRRLARPWRASASLDDAGSRATGRLQGSLALAVDDVFGINDLMHLTVNGDVERDGSAYGTRGDSAYYSWPYGYWTFSLSGSRYDYHQTVQGTNQVFVSSGTSQNLEARVHRMLYRAQTFKTGLQLRVYQRQLRNFIDDTEVLVQRRDVSVAEPAITHRQFIGPATLDLQLARPLGVPWFDATPDPVAAAPDAPTNRYRLWLVDAALGVPWRLGPVPLRYSAAFRSQRADTGLFATEFFSIGNRYTVRGYSGDVVLAAENGWFLRNDLAAPLGATGQQVYAGFDYGAVSGPSAHLLPGDRLSGAVLGLRGGGRGFSYDAFVGWPLSRPDGFGVKQPVTGFFVTYQY